MSFTALETRIHAMRTPIVLVVLTALVCAGLLGIVGFTRAQTEYKMSLRGAASQRYTVGEDYEEDGVRFNIEPDGYQYLVHVDIILLSTMKVAHKTYLSYMPDVFNDSPYNLKNTPGEYRLEYRYGEDPNAQILTRDLCYSSVKGTQIELYGFPEVTLECRAGYPEDPMAWAIDECDGDISHLVQKGEMPDFNAVGSGTGYYFVTNSQGVVSEVTREFIIEDTKKPVITIESRDLINIPLHGEFLPPEATAYDECEGDLSDEIDVDTSALNPDEKGDYEVIYSVMDSSGNEATAILTVRVGCQSEGPEITLEGEEEVDAECGYEFTDPGYTAWDECDEDLTDFIEISDFPPDGFESVGQVVRTYTVENSGGTLDTKTRIINVVDTKGPDITLNGRDTVSLVIGEKYIELGATAVDACEGDVEIQWEGEVDSDNVGRYEIIYSAVDSHGNPSQKKRLVRVGCGEAQLVLEGKMTINVQCSEETYEEPGFTAWDACEDDLSEDVIISYPQGEIDETVPGQYRIIYDLYDKRVFRTVNVIDTKKPEVTLNPPNPMTVFIGTEFVDPGATAWDACFGDLTDRIGIIGADKVDIHTEGTYTIFYRVVDAYGNLGEEKRTVEVGYDPAKPIVKLYGDAIVTVECGDSFEDPGAYAYNDLETETYEVKATKLPDDALQTPGEYVIIYSAVNELGNTMDVSRKVIVEDTKDPAIVLRGDDEIIVDQGTAYVDPGVLSAWDECDGDLKDSVIFTSTVDTSLAGTYHVEYFVRDSTANLGRAVRTVQVREVSAVIEGEDPIEGEGVVPVEGEPSLDEGEAEGEDEGDETPCCGCFNWLGNLFLAGLSLAFLIFIICYNEQH